MARYTGPKCKLCRREGEKLFLKGERCHTPKCPIEKRNRPPGMHGWRRGRPSDYATGLREKQKAKRYYGVLEKQFRRYFDEASVGRGDTGERLFSLLERRLDNVLVVCGFARSRAQARQMVGHGHVQVNGRKVRASNCLVEEGDIVRPAPENRTLEEVRARREQSGHPAPSWLEINDADLTIRMLREPVRQDVSLDVDEELVVEHCSR